MKVLLLGLPVFLAASINVMADEARGRAVYEHWCAHCHDEKPGAPGRLKLEWKRGLKNSVLTDRVDLASEYVTAVVRRGRAEMPSFRKTEISDPDLEALAAYLAPNAQ